VQGINSNVSIVSVTSGVPKSFEINSEIANLSGRSEYATSLIAQLGVVQRHVVNSNQFGSHLGTEVLRRSLDLAGWGHEELDFLIVGTQTPDQLFPGISSMIHKNLKLSKKTAVFDFNLGCSAYVYGAWIAGKLMQNQPGSRGALVTVDTMSRTIGIEDLGNRLLFGDGASATLFEFSETAADMFFTMSSDGGGVSSVVYPNSGMSQEKDLVPEFLLNGPSVLGMSLKVFPKVLGELASMLPLGIDSIDLIIPHQANGFILEKIESLGYSKGIRLVNEMKNFGNTSSASIPIAISSTRHNFPDLDLSKIALIGFGTGFSYGGVTLDLSHTSISEVLELDDN
jgi:3-oxoacyl-[acyl-carrier-protein] synthase-3